MERVKLLMSGCPGKVGKEERLVEILFFILSRIEVVQLEVGDVRPEPSTGTACLLTLHPATEALLKLTLLSCGSPTLLCSKHGRR